MPPNSVEILLRAHYSGRETSPMYTAILETFPVDRLECPTRFHTRYASTLLNAPLYVTPDMRARS